MTNIQITLDENAIKRLIEDYARDVYNQHIGPSSEVVVGLTAAPCEVTTKIGAVITIVGATED